MAILLCTTLFPGIPVATAMTLVALGATLATINRLRSPVAAAIHLSVYSSLYLFFVGAVCHAAMTGPRDGLTFLQGVDFGVSAMLMSVVVRLCVAALCANEDLPRR